MSVSLVQECKLLFPFQTGANYVLHISPIMSSIVRTLDLEQLRLAASRAYLDLTGHPKPLPKYFGTN